MTEPALTFDDLDQGLASGGSLVLLSEYDGALAPFMSDPDAPRPSAATTRDLRALARSRRMRIGVLSGRALGDLCSRVPVPGLIYAGCHGLEVRGRRLRFLHPAAAAQRPKFEALTRAIREGVGRIRGVIVESKGLAIAVHYRHVAPAAVPVVEGEVGALVTVLASQAPATRIVIGRGNRALEILPEVGWTRGDCALWIWSHVAPALPSPVMLLYLADDWTDETAFEALSGRAVTVRIGAREEPTQAAYRLPDARHLHRLLSALAARMSERRAS